MHASVNSIPFSPSQIRARASPLWISTGHARLRTGPRENGYTKPCDGLPSKNRTGLARTTAVISRTPLRTVAATPRRPELDEERRGGRPRQRDLAGDDRRLAMAPCSLPKPEAIGEGPIYDLHGRIYVGAMQIAGGGGMLRRLLETLGDW